MNSSALIALNAPLLAARMEQGSPASPLRELTAGLARGDDVAWAQFHREYGPRIFRQLLAATRGDHDLASEALQQAYLRIARHARPCEAEPMFLAWLRVVSRTALSDCRRRRHSFWSLLHRRHDDPTDRDASDDDDGRLQLALESALEKLDAEDRALLEAKYFSGADVRSIAAQIGVSAKAVESRLTRARATLRSHLVSALARHE
ncbi:MAG TPA: sigma-70 family RNA polymerase sigma factor [Opitutaceae bacterium]|nr:sigma-70 family RNA polymerase sigma factor [Opitutaceae bacterium]